MAHITKIRLPQRIVIKPTLNDVWHMQPDEFTIAVRKYLAAEMRSGSYKPNLEGHKKRFLSDQERTWLIEQDLEFLSQKLGVKGRAFLMDKMHCKLLTKVDRAEVRVYEPVSGEIQTYDFNRLSRNLDYVVVTQDIRHAYNRARERRKDLYSLPNHLAATEYSVNEKRIQELGQVQRDGVNCIPLCIYAAAQTLRPNIR